MFKFIIDISKEVFLSLLSPLLPPRLIVKPSLFSRVYSRYILALDKNFGSVLNSVAKICSFIKGYHCYLCKKRFLFIRRKRCEGYTHPLRVTHGTIRSYIQDLTSIPTIAKKLNISTAIVY